MAAATKTSTKTAVKKTTPAPVPEVEVVEGSWQETVLKSHKLLQRGIKATGQAGGMLWIGAQAGIIDWLDDRSADDVNAEGIYNEVVGLLGSKRRGDAHKIKQIALAVRDHGLTLASHKSLNDAGKEAKRLLVEAPQNEADDNAADEAITALAETAPASTKTPEGAALIVLKGGIDEAARLLLDALNGGVEVDGKSVENVAAHRALLRAISQEMKGREPKPEPKAKAPAKPKVAAKPGAAKGKARPKPNPKVDTETLAAEDPEAEGIDEADIPDSTDEVADDTDMFDGIEDEVDGDHDEPDVDAEPVVKPKPKPKAKPVVRRA